MDAHHIVERHGVLTIIAIGEIVTGTVITLQGIKDREEQSIDWSDAILVAVCGTALVFSMWWAYFISRFAEMLQHHRLRSFGFGYSHFLIWLALAAVGGGLHVMALSVESGEGHRAGQVVVALAVAVRIGLFIVGLCLAHYCTTRIWADLHTAVLAATLVVPRVRRVPGR